MRISKHKIAGYIIAGTFLAAGLITLAHSEKTEEAVIRITAKKFEFEPNQITLKKGEPVTLELVSLDRVHGFNLPELGIRADIIPGQSTKVHLVPQTTGSFTFRCDIFCGSGHEDMAGQIIVVE